MKKIDIRNEINRVSFEGLIGKKQVDEEYAACYYTYYYLCRIYGVQAESNIKEMEQSISYLKNGLNNLDEEMKEIVAEDIEELQFIKKKLKEETLLQKLFSPKKNN